jgi:hypothetical protein
MDRMAIHHPHTHHPIISSTNNHPFLRQQPPTPWGIPPDPNLSFLLAQMKELKKTSTLTKPLTDGRPLSRLDNAKASFALCSLLHRLSYMERM